MPCSDHTRDAFVVQSKQAWQPRPAPVMKAKRRAELLVVILLAGLLSAPWAEASRIVVANDEWPLSDAGFSAEPVNASRFALNVASYFTGGTPGHFLVYSDNFGLIGSSLQTAMTAAGHSWTIDPSIPFTLSHLTGFDAVFLGGNPYSFSATVLIDYVNAGGGVYLVGGTGAGGATAEASTWNPFLQAFGLGFDLPWPDPDRYNDVVGSIPISSSHPLFSGVTALFQKNGNTVVDLDPTDPHGQVLVWQGETGLYGVYAAPSATVPEPSTIGLIASGIGALLWRTWRREQPGQAPRGDGVADPTGKARSAMATTRAGCSFPPPTGSHRRAT